MSYSFILEIKPLLVTLFANIFSHPVDCLFILLMGLPRWLSRLKSPCNAGDAGSIPGSEDPLEEGMATHSTVLVWRIPRTEKPGRLQSMGSQRVGYD